MIDAGTYDEYAAIADLYDLVPMYHDRPDIAFLVDAARDAGGPVLEIGCGTGRVLIPTARAGIGIVGLDLSASMLEICRQRLREDDPSVQSRVTLVHGDMRDFSLRRTFKLITVPFRPFQHLLTVEDQRSCLASIHRHLDVDGRLIVDLFNPSLDALARPDDGKEFGDEPPFAAPGGRTVVRRHRIVSHDRFNQIIRVELMYDVTHPDGHEQRLMHAFPMRYVFRFEAEHLLARCGFSIEALYSDFDRNPYGSTYPGELIFVARRTA